MFFCSSGFVESQNVWLFVGDLELDNESLVFPKIRAILVYVNNIYHAFD